MVTCRDLPPLITQGEDEQDALAQAADAMDEVFATYIIEGIEFPEPSKARRREGLAAPPAGTLAKAALFVAMREAGISKLQLARQLGVDEKEVRRLLDPKHPTKLGALTDALRRLGRRLVIAVEHSSEYSAEIRP